MTIMGNLSSHNPWTAAHSGGFKKLLSCPNHTLCSRLVRIASLSGPPVFGPHLMVTESTSWVYHQGLWCACVGSVYISLGPLCSFDEACIRSVLGCCMVNKGIVLGAHMACTGFTEFRAKRFGCTLGRREIFNSETL